MIQKLKNWTVLLFIKVTILIVGLSLSTNGQDSLVFSKKKNASRIFKIPLSEYGLIIKSKEGKKTRAIITAFKDSTLDIKIWTFNIKDAIQAKQLDTLMTTASLKDMEFKKMRQQIKLELNNAIRKKQLEALDEDKSHDNIMFKRKQLQLEFGLKSSIRIDEIKILRIDNSNRREMKRFNHILNIIGGTSMSMLATALLLKSGLLTIIADGIVLIYAPIAIITSNKRINLKHWKIKALG